MNTDVPHTPNVRVACIVCTSKNEVLVAKHQKHDRSYWVFPGGHLEYGESLSQCALRELEEESNLQGKFERLVFISESIAPDNSRHIINFFALVSVDEKQEMQVGNDEDVLVELAYVPIARIKELTLYPNIADRLQREHESGWQHPGIQLVHTPWL